MEQISGGVTAPRGFLAAGTAAGIKENKKDMAMIYSERECRCAGTFTTNVVKAAPVKWDQRIVCGKKPVHAVVINSGIANTCTGEEGKRICEETAREAAGLFQIGEDQVLVASTGVIGVQVPVDKIKTGLALLKPKLRADAASASDAAEAIMTTDTRKKEIAVRTRIGGKTVTVGGMCKGSGMIHPNMCTMLSFVTTDAAICAELLQKALSASVPDTYNMVSIDGDTSTNDTCLLLANGSAGNPEITEENEDYQAFLAALNEVNTCLAKQMAADGEGASRLFEVKVIGAKEKEQAVRLSKAIVSSTLTKAAIYGCDANWGRILCAMGYSGTVFDPERVDLYFQSPAGEIQVVENGRAAGFEEEEAARILSENAVTVIADVKMGEASATAWGCDLTHEYVSINADYRS